MLLRRMARSELLLTHLYQAFQEVEYLLQAELCFPFPESCAVDQLVQACLSTRAQACRRYLPACMHVFGPISTFIVYRSRDELRH